MKKILSLLLLLLVTGAAADAPREIRPRVVTVRGTVEIREASGAWRRVQERERIRVGARIRTGEGSQATIELSDRNHIGLGERAEFSFVSGTVATTAPRTDALLGGRGRAYEIRCELTEGTMSSLLRGLGPQGSSNFSLRTPIATIGVRGTDFVTTVKGGGGNAPAPTPASPPVPDALQERMRTVGEMYIRNITDRARANQERGAAPEAAFRKAIRDTKREWTEENKIPTNLEPVFDNWGHQIIDFGREKGFELEVSMIFHAADWFQSWWNENPRLTRLVLAWWNEVGTQVDIWVRTGEVRVVPDRGTRREVRAGEGLRLRGGASGPIDATPIGAADPEALRELELRLVPFLRVTEECVSGQASPY